ncbi:PIN domain-containing protein [Lentzea flaviverrucosa]|uniref:PIN domain-containing protein n=1 Tax=Lentzea flaviverrucosa TaxID=200379 RepID=A0A1H9B7N9_9PSEU|nr:PIN domain-containing protein [Lentzea flaviverrucosa]RDI31857.1 PIN domain-containing protein [Lentzea flaviverrucosa]SEP85032.1 PIN domain-containing protein [Lentzea flaviverrucosa]
MRLKQGVTAPAAADTLGRVLTALGNLRGHRNDPATAYLRWAGDAERQLQQLFVEPDLAQGVRSARYVAILNLRGAAASDMSLMPLYQEIEHQYAALSEVQQQLARLLDLARRPGDLILVYDTNSLMHYQPPNRITWSRLFDAPGLVRLVVPLCVIAELDEKGHTGSAAMAKRARAASRALREITDAVAAGRAAKLVHPDTGAVLGATLEVLLEERGHRRLPQVDDELVDQAVVLAGLSGTPVRLLTHDLNLGLRARAAGVDAVELPMAFRRDRDDG